MKINIWLLLFFILVVIFIFREGCKPGPEEIIITKIDTVYGDPEIYSIEVEVPVPEPVYIDTGSTKWKYHKVDTNAILADYFSKYHYDDTLINDTSAFFRVMAHTYMNKLYYDSLLFQNRRKTAIGTTNIYPVKNRFKMYIGMGVGGSANSFDISGDLMFIPKNDKLAFSGKYGIISGNIYITTFLKIRIKKSYNEILRESYQ